MSLRSKAARSLVHVSCLSPGTSKFRSFLWLQWWASKCFALLWVDTDFLWEFLEHHLHQWQTFLNKYKVSVQVTRESSTLHLKPWNRFFAILKVPLQCEQILFPKHLLCWKLPCLLISLSRNSIIPLPVIESSHYINFSSLDKTVMLLFSWSHLL